MTTIKIKKNDHESKLSLQAGIDVGSEELVLVIRKNNKPFDPQKFTNTPADRARVVKKLIKLPGIIVCLEATGIYHFDLAVALHDAGVLLMVVNSKASHNFAKGGGNYKHPSAESGRALGTPNSNGFSTFNRLAACRAKLGRR